MECAERTGNLTSICKNKDFATSSQAKPATEEANKVGVESRHCRCMFCGEQLKLSSENEAVEHMRVCVALQEQLASKEQFTVPSAVKAKMKSAEVTLGDK